MMDDGYNNTFLPEGHHWSRDLLVDKLAAINSRRVDVCRDCYHVYAALRKIQIIYDDTDDAFGSGVWCCYCDHLAKYHVDLDDWVGMPSPSRGEGKRNDL